MPQVDSIVDPTLDDLRMTRHEISESCHHDPQALVAYYLQMQESYEPRLLALAAPTTVTNSLPPAVGQVEGTTATKN